MLYHSRRGEWLKQGIACSIRRACGYQEKLTPPLRLKYNNPIADAAADPGRPEEIGSVFAGFQKYLYQQAAALTYVDASFQVPDSKLFDSALDLLEESLYPSPLRFLWKANRHAEASCCATRSTC
jgi:hypothetical protein